MARRPGKGRGVGDHMPWTCHGPDAGELILCLRDESWMNLHTLGA